MRTRHNNKASRIVNRSAGSTMATHTYCSGTPASDTSSQAYGAVTNSVSAGRDERITDSLGKGSSHPCVHRVKVFDINDNIGATTFANVVGNRTCVTNYNVPYNWYDNSNLIVFGVRDWSVDNDSSVPPGWSFTGSYNEAAARSRLLEQARGLKADVLLNIVEANQVWPSIRSLANCIPNMARHWLEIRRVIKTASAAFLAWKFGVSPILTDIMAVNRYLPKLADDIRRFTKGDGFKYSSSATLTANPPDEIWFQSSTSLFTCQSQLLAAPTIRYVLSVKPADLPYSPFSKAAHGVASRFSTSPARLAWELVPFSFVVDWFLDLRGALNILDDLLGFSPYRIASFTRSFAYSCAIQHYLRTMSPCDGSLLQDFRQCSIEYKHYERSIVGGTQSLALNPRFGKNQAAISAALILQRLTQMG